MDGVVVEDGGTEELIVEGASTKFFLLRWMRWRNY
jgi:hypothetical protein